MKTLFGRTGRTDARWLASLVLAGAVALAGCDDESLLPPEPSDGMFTRYVALGSSTTSGFQSGGINDSTQRQSFSLMLAEAMGLEAEGGDEFNLPLFNKPGCPPPYTDILAGTRLAGGSDTDCSLRSRPIPEVVHNVAVPGAEVSDVLSNSGDDSNANPLTQFILGGRTQIEAAADARPTFVSVFIGGNDILDAVTQGDPSLATSPTQFQTDYAALVEKLKGMDLEGAVLVGIPQVMAFDTQARPTFPHLSLGVAYFQASQSPGWPSNYTVNNNCAPNTVFADGKDGHLSAVPFGYGFGVLFAQAQAGVSVELDCLNDAPVLTNPDATSTTTEFAQVAGLIQAYNQVIQGAASDNGWAYAATTPRLVSLRDAGLIPAFPTIDDPSTPLFGPIFSQDGIHVSERGHLEFANVLVNAINAEYGTSLATPE